MGGVNGTWTACSFYNWDRLFLAIGPLTGKYLSMDQEIRGTGNEGRVAASTDVGEPE